jgi:hypothetical protein
VIAIAISRVNQNINSLVDTQDDMNAIVTVRIPFGKETVGLPQTAPRPSSGRANRIESPVCLLTQNQTIAFLGLSPCPLKNCVRIERLHSAVFYVFYKVF